MGGSYTSLPYSPPVLLDPGRSSGRIIDLILRRGDIAAAARAKTADTWGDAIRTLGIIGGGYAQERQQKRQQEQQAAAFNAAIQSWDGQDLKGLFATISPIVGPEPATRIVSGLGSLSRAKADPNAFKTSLGGVVAAYEALGDDWMRQNWTGLRQMLGDAAAQYLPQETMIPPEYTPEVGKYLTKWYANIAGGGATGASRSIDQEILAAHAAGNQDRVNELLQLKEQMGAAGRAAPRLSSAPVMHKGRRAFANYDPETGRYMIGGQDVTSEVSPIMPASVTVNAAARAATEADEKLNATALVEGRTVPQMYSKRTNQSLFAEADRISMERTGKPFNHVRAVLQYEAGRRHVLAMNSTQQMRFRALAESVVNTIDEVQDLTKKLRQGNVQAFNRAKRNTVLQLYGNTPQSAIAARYQAAVGVLQEEFANLAQGGYAPTESAWHLAMQQINSDFGLHDMAASLQEVQRLINYRVLAFENLEPAYLEGTAPAVPGAPSPGGLSPEADAFLKKLEEQ